MLCREQVASLVDESPRLTAAGISVVIIGNGRVEHARAFAGERAGTLPLYTDPGLQTYEALGAKRGLMTTLHPGVLKRGREVAKKGFTQGATQGSAFQQGGALGVHKDGRVWFRQLSDYAGDHFRVEDVLRVER